MEEFCLCLWRLRAARGEASGIARRIAVTASQFATTWIAIRLRNGTRYAFTCHNHETYKRNIYESDSEGKQIVDGSRQRRPGCFQKKAKEQHTN